MRIVIKSGDIFSEQADVLVSTANPQLNMSGGINGEILLRGGEDVQHQLHDFLARTHRRFVAAGTAVVTGPGPLRNFKHIVHAVAIDAWYQSSRDIVAAAAGNALEEAAKLGASTLAMPGLAMGYGRLPAKEFAEGLKAALEQDYPPVTAVTVVLRNSEDASIVEAVLGKTDKG